MNDASGERVEEHIQKLEADAKVQKAHDAEHDQPHLDPSRWWFASSAFPMIAATLGPVASSFSICALVRPWRQSMPPGTTIDAAPFVNDPLWLTVINAIQLAIAIVANLALLLNMTKRLRFSVAQPVTIIGWYISSICLICLTATAAGPLVIQPIQDYVWSQAFFYGVYSSILYFLVASLMTATFLGAQAGHYTKDFNLTPSQRTLMLQTIMLQVYLLLGALVFSNIEGWSYLDAVYWAAVTLFTVGFGDMYATTALGRALLLPYSLVGIISLGLVIGSIRSLVLERARRRFDARLVERRRQQMVRRIARKGKDYILEPVREEQSPGPSGAGADLTEFERREKEFKLMRKIQQTAAARRRWYAMAISTSTTLALWMVGAKILQEFELPYQGWSYFDGFYFAFISLTTIGYGDITPVSNGGKSFWVFWALLALPTMTVLISNAGDTIVKGIRDLTDQVATVTILPGERGFRKDLKKFLKMLSFGALFEEDIEDEAPGFFGQVPHPDPDSDRDDNDVKETLDRDENELLAEGAAPETAKQRKEKDDEEENVHARRVEANTASEKKSPSGAQAISDGKASASETASSRDDRPGTTEGVRGPERPPPKSSSTAKALEFARTASMPRQSLPDIPSDRASYHVTLIEEIGRVMQHLKNQPPRKYSFQEWAWYLKLIGEDEGDADRHNKPHVHRHGKNLGLRKRGGHKDGDKEEELRHAETWSWVGTRSPLMGSKEEAEWVLEKLTQRLTEELREMRKSK